MGEPRAERARLSVPRVARADDQRWSALHHGIDPGSVLFLRTWLRLVRVIARPLVMLRVPPTVITAFGVLCGVGALLAVPSAAWAAAVLVMIAALCDAFDGAVAVLADAASRPGALADAMADRVVDVFFALVIWRAGAPLWAALVAASLAVGVDLSRRVVRCPAVITVAERPSWTICATLACLAAAVSTYRWPAGICVAVWIVLGVVGLVQLAAASRPRGVTAVSRRGQPGGRAR